ncbi:aminoacyltransferase [Staphylococcus pseudintermedius]|uniref:aminoacyltransferase n=1 Tax=Staphylococcus pseudintermedius TaxID=283734 RepID=UPI0018F70CE3|nr:aminoacyltransferase [Staphylococcus pseudintermedius]MBJ8243949.1 aminoacyltransferase [Staphylococcus pseudintermedius]MBJ8255428.1 aminoacyltransferase [Staphylococcus pseudintermedius]
MYFTQLSVDDFDAFVTNHFSHYTQDAGHYHYRNKYKNDVHLVGVKNYQDEVIAACLLTEARALKFFKYFYTHRGPVLDYNNLELVQFFFEHLTQYLKKQRCLYVLIDPYVRNHIRDAKGNITQHFEHAQLFKTLDRLGYKHQGFPIGYSSHSQIRWLSVLDLKDKSEQQLLEEMDYQTRRNIKKTYEMDVQVKTLPIEETERFFKLFQMAEEKHGFTFRDLPYFEEMQKMYAKNSMIKLAFIDLNDLLKKQTEKLDTLKATIAETQVALESHPNSKKNKTKLKQTEQQLQAQERKIEKTRQLIVEDGEILDLAAAIYIYNRHEVYYLSSGSNPKYNAYMGAYRLQWEMIQFAKQQGIDRYNFYGITGDFTKHAEDYGVQRFKEGFGAHVEEYVGDFVKPIMPMMYRCARLLKR